MLGGFNALCQAVSVGCDSGNVAVFHRKAHAFQNRAGFVGGNAERYAIDDISQIFTQKRNFLRAFQFFDYRKLVHGQAIKLALGVAIAYFHLVVAENAEFDALGVEFFYEFGKKSAGNDRRTFHFDFGGNGFFDSQFHIGCGKLDRAVETLQFYSFQHGIYRFGACRFDNFTHRVGQIVAVANYFHIAPRKCKRIFHLNYITARKKSQSPVAFSLK